MKFRQILAGSNLGRNPSPKQEPQKILLKPSKRISTNAISTNKSALRKQIQRNLVLFYQTLPQEIPTNKSPAKVPYPQNKIYQKLKEKYLQTTLSQKFPAKHIKDFSNNTKLTRALFQKKQGNLCKRELSQTNNYIQETYVFSFLQKNTTKNIQTTSHRKYFTKKCSPQNLF